MWGFPKSNWVRPSCKGEGSNQDWFREPGTHGNHAPNGQSQNNGSSANSQDILVSMENERLEGTEDQSITSVDEEDLRRNVHMRRSGI